MMNMALFIVRDILLPIFIANIADFALISQAFGMEFTHQILLEESRWTSSQAFMTTGSFFMLYG